MGFDIAEWTVRVLEDGLPPLPDRLELGQTVPVAFWRGEKYGAVLFVRLWKNGQPDSDCAITERREDGSWDEPSSWGGSAWIDDPLSRPADGWDGDPVVWLGSSGRGEVADEDDWPGWARELPTGDPAGETSSEIVAVPSDMPEEEVDAMFAALDEKRRAEELADSAELDVRVIEGAASMRVAAIEVEHAGRRWTVPIDSPAGAFLVGIEGRGPAALRALDASGATLDENHA
jgi:hypothetical protein